jgi:glycerophosphoryl diester phosphodiesterase
VLAGVFRDLRSSWKDLALIDLVYKLVALSLLTPLVGVLSHALLAASGRAVLADQELLFFLLEPAGWLCFVVVGALSIAVVALEQAALMATLAGAEGERIGFVAALRFASARAWPVLLVAARMVGGALLALAPFGVAAGLVYGALLGEFDINFYLLERPPEFRTAVWLGGALLATLLALLLWLFSGWLFALPLVLFEAVTPAEALKSSRARVAGRRLGLMAAIGIWAFATTLVATFASALVVGLGRALVPRVADSLALLAATTGAILLFWAATSLAVNLLGTTTFAALWMNCYERWGRGAQSGAPVARVVTGREATRGSSLSRRRLAIVVLVGFAASLAIGAGILWSVPAEDAVEVTAHRGSSAAAPENTLAAVERAIEDGADWVEIDVQETADGEVVVFHDSDFMKLAGVNLKIWDATLADLQEIDVGSRFAPEFAGERVPTLGEVLDLCRGRVGVNIELKYYGHDEQLERRVVEVVEAHRMADEIVLMSLERAAVGKLKSLRPAWKVGLLMSVSAGDLRRVDADFLAVNAGFADRRFIRSAHRNGKQVHVWTVNDAATMSTMIGRGVDSLITDVPALARSVIEQRARMSVPERALLELAEFLGAPPEFDAF